MLCPRILPRITPKGRDSSTTNKWEVHLKSICGTWNSAHCYAAAQMGEEFGGEWIHVYVWQSPFAIHLKLSQYY